MNLKLAIVVFSFSFVVVIYVGLVRQGQEDLDTKTMLPFQLKPMLREQFKDQLKDLGKKKRIIPAVTNQSSWSLDQFKSSYPNYRIEQTPDGRVLSLIGAVDGQFEPRAKVQGFHPQNREKVLENSQAILSELSSIFGVTSDMPLGLPEISSTDLTAQVVYHQTSGGLPIEPGASISLIQGHDGKLKAAYSSYIPKAKIVNQRKVAGVGRPILWVQSSEPVAELRHAYETRTQGVQKVVDAEDNSVLLNRDKRIY